MNSPACIIATRATFTISDRLNFFKSPHAIPMNQAATIQGIFVSNIVPYPDFRC